MYARYSRVLNEIGGEEEEGKFIDVCIVKEDHLLPLMLLLLENLTGQNEEEEEGIISRTAERKKGKILSSTFSKKEINRN